MKRFPTGQQLASALQAVGIIDAAAVDDPEGYDNYATLEKVNAAAKGLRSGDSEPSENWHEEQRRVALESFRIVQGPGDAGSELEWNCRRPTEQSGWMRLAARIIEGF